MNSKLIDIDFLKNRDKEGPEAPPVESREEKLIRLQRLIEEGLYEPDMGELAESLIQKLLCEEDESSKK